MLHDESHTSNLIGQGEVCLARLSTHLYALCQPSLTMNTGENQQVLPLISLSDFISSHLEHLTVYVSYTRQGIASQRLEILCGQEVEDALS
jgi:hypothetical protein